MSCLFYLCYCLRSADLWHMVALGLLLMCCFSGLRLRVNILNSYWIFSSLDTEKRGEVAAPTHQCPLTDEKCPPRNVFKSASHSLVPYKHQPGRSHLTPSTSGRAGSRLATTTRDKFLTSMLPTLVWLNSFACNSWQWPTADNSQRCMENTLEKPWASRHLYFSRTQL